MKAITIIEPWASLIVDGLKDIENRSRVTAYRGKVLIHTSQKLEPEQFAAAARTLKKVPHDAYVRAMQLRYHMREASEYPLGHIIGIAEITDCVLSSENPWFSGPRGYVLANARRFETPIPCCGALGIWDPFKNLSACKPPEMVTRWQSLHKALPELNRAATGAPAVEESCPVCGLFGLEEITWASVGREEITAACWNCGWMEALP